MKVIALTNCPATAKKILDTLRTGWRADIEYHHATCESSPDLVDMASLVVVDWGDGAEHCAHWIQTAKARVPNAVVFLLGGRRGSGTLQPQIFAMVDAVVPNLSSLRKFCSLLDDGLPLSKKSDGLPSSECMPAFVEAARRTFAAMCGMELIQRSNPDPEAGALPGGISSIIRFGGEAAGWVAISMPEPLAAIVADGMLGDTEDHLSPDDVGDAVGELVNIIAGQAKASLVGTPHHFSIGIPEIVSGRTITTEPVADTSQVTVVFDANGHAVHLQVCMPAGDSAHQ